MDSGKLQHSWTERSSWNHETSWTSHAAMSNFVHPWCLGWRSLLGCLLWMDSSLQRLATTTHDPARGEPQEAWHSMGILPPWWLQLWDDGLQEWVFPQQEMVGENNWWDLLEKLQSQSMSPQSSTLFDSRTWNLQNGVLSSKDGWIHCAALEEATSSSPASQASDFQDWCAMWWGWKLGAQTTSCGSSRWSSSSSTRSNFEWNHGSFFTWWWTWWATCACTFRRPWRSTWAFSWCDRPTWWCISKRPRCVASTALPLSPCGWPPNQQEPGASLSRCWPWTMETSHGKELQVRGLWKHQAWRIKFWKCATSGHMNPSGHGKRWDLMPVNGLYLVSASNWSFCFS